MAGTVLIVDLFGPFALHSTVADAGASFRVLVELLVANSVAVTSAVLVVAPLVGHAVEHGALRVDELALTAVSIYYLAHWASLEHAGVGGHAFASILVQDEVQELWALQVAKVVTLFTCAGRVIVESARWAENVFGALLVMIIITMLRVIRIALTGP